MENKRDSSIDLMKGLLVVGMILAHTFQLLSNINESATGLAISNFVNLVSFSGFMFCFGFVSWFAYFNKKSVYFNVLKTSAKCYIAYIISGQMFLVLIGGVKTPTLIDVMVLNIVPGYSEFLLTFSFITLLALPLKKIIKSITSNFLLSAACIVIFIVASSLVSPFEGNNLISEFVGGYNYCYFPIVKYFPLYLMGVHFARHKDAKNNIFMVMSLLFFIYLVFTHYTTSRFPPSYLWIVSSIFPVISYYLICTKLNSLIGNFVVNHISKIGKNVLFYLIASNGIIFTLRSSMYEQISTVNYFIVAFIIVSSIGYLISIVVNK